MDLISSGAQQAKETLAGKGTVTTNDLFSECVIAYRDVVKPVVTPGKPGVNTTDRTGILFYGLLAVFGAVDAAAVILFRKKYTRIIHQLLM